MDSIDYEEPVTLLMEGEKPRHLSLAAAVMYVMNLGSLLTRLHAAIVREGEPIIKLSEIEEIYARPDFPRQ